MSAISEFRSPRHLRLNIAARVALLLVFTSGAVWFFFHLPDNINPFSPLEIADEPNLVTPLKLRILGARPEACAGVIKRAGVEVTRAPILSAAPDCGADDAMTLRKSLVVYGDGVEMTCLALTALMIWERHVAIPAAHEEMGADLTRIVHYGSYQCRNVNGAREGKRSKHATARAVDIAGFQFSDGQKISVLKDWGQDTPAGRYLKRAHDGACEVFNGVLGPDYNALHANHFHFERGAWNYCK